MLAIFPPHVAQIPLPISFWICLFLLPTKTLIPKYRAMAIAAAYSGGINGIIPIIKSNIPRTHVSNSSSSPGTTILTKA
ncbi:MAG: hypothetical protein HY295_03600 [Thaumarchaeota archaeon]|nr:hypothetical protein [Nitrososphaerota archaeon]